jgi:hypothetical protein
VFQLLYILIQALQPFLVPICFVVAWSFILLVGWTMWSAIRDTTARAKQMHEIPCANCQFFTNDYRLKCTVQPTLANTEEAVHCFDYQAK